MRSHFAAAGTDSHPSCRARCLMFAMLLLATGSASANSTVTIETKAIDNLVGATSNPKTDSAGPGGIAQVDGTTNAGGIVGFLGSLPVAQHADSAAFAAATEGLLRASAVSSVSTAEFFDNSISATASARANWTDLLTITAAGKTGSGTLFATVRLDGIIDLHLGPQRPLLDNPAVDVSVQVLGTGLGVGPSCGGWSFCARIVNRPPLPGTTHNTLVPTMNATIPFTFGAPISLGYTLDLVSVSIASTFPSGGGTSASGTLDFTSSMVWGGITSVVDATGTAVTAYSAVAASGFDYVRAVPEPRVYVLLLAGLLLVVAAARRPR